MVGVSHREGHPFEDVIVGFGAHVDPRIAAIRALTEVSQFLPTVEARDSDGMTIYGTDDPATVAWLRETKIADEPWLQARTEAARAGGAEEFFDEQVQEKGRQLDADQQTAQGSPTTQALPETQPSELPDSRPSTEARP